MNGIIPILTRLNPNDPNAKQGNPGDYYIFLGIQYLLTKLLSSEPSWLLLSKFNPDECRVFLEHVRKVGFAIYAGMPQYNRFSDWCFWYDEGFWSEFIEQADARVLSIGGGTGFPIADLSSVPEDFTKEWMNDPKTVEILELRRQRTVLFTVRDQYAKSLLDAANIPSHLLPCPAIFAGHRVRAQVKNDGLCLVVPPGPTSICQGDDSQEQIVNWTTRICRILQEHGRKPIVICHGGREWTLLRERTSLDVRYSNNYLWQLRMFESCSEMVAARIHGIIPTYGMGQARCVGFAVDSRANALCTLQSGQAHHPEIPILNFYEYSRSQSPDALDGHLIEALEQALPCDLAWLESVEKQYLELIGAALASLK